MSNRKTCIVLSILVVILASALFAQKAPLTLDEFFNSVAFTAVKISPDGHSVVVGTHRADWDQSIFRHDLWLYCDDGKGSGTLTQLTQSGHDTEPSWSPDGRWIAFMSDRKRAGSKTGDAGDENTEVAHLYVISVNGGEAFPITRGDEDVHTFAWAQDSRTLYYATRIPWTKAQQDAYKKEWKDVQEYRDAERGDQIFSITIDDALANLAAEGTKAEPGKDDKDKKEENTSGAVPRSKALGALKYRIADMDVSPDGKKIALASTSISSRMEIYGDYEIYVLDLANAAPDRAPRQLTHNEAIEQRIRWAPDSRHVFFTIGLGASEGKYQDYQPRLFSLDSESGQIQRWASKFDGAMQDYEVTGSGVVATGNVGTQVQLYTEASPDAAFNQVQGWPGTFNFLSAAKNSPRIAFGYSSLQKPAEIYIAESADRLREAKRITAFNKLFTERELPQGKPYQWKGDGGTTIEGMLIYPPGKFEARNLPMLTLIHGGPADADGDHFEADWYQWSALAASQGWLVFQPNYRGSTGYGDKFLQQIVPQIVSRPGKDILEGVDALVKDGIANPDRLAIGGYSYGGYMTNWLITQTTRFKAAMTGAGAVEHVSNWGNDDMTFDDAYFLGGKPWEAPQRYQEEAAIFQINKVRTPTHMVAGGSDIRVAVSQNYLLDRALHTLGVPSSLLIFPGEGHGLGKNPWHGKIKVREELKWLEKYGK